MSKLFNNQYRIDSARLPNWDYRNTGVYFITICTHNREHFFGKISNGEMELSNLGAIANVLWYEIRNRTNNVRLGEFIVMPNHMHGILILKDIGITKGRDIDINDNVNTDINDAVENVDAVETLHATSLHHQRHAENWNGDYDAQTNPYIIKSKLMSKISPKKNAVSTIIRSYKSAVTKHANRLNLKFKWQTRFYDHIVDNDRSFQNISNYIINNPANWKKDKFIE